MLMAPVGSGIRLAEASGGKDGRDALCPGGLPRNSASIDHDRLIEFVWLESREFASRLAGREGAHWTLPALFLVISPPGPGLTPSAC
jgi:hypothetical protein